MAQSQIFSKRGRISIGYTMYLAKEKEVGQTRTITGVMYVYVDLRHQQHLIINHNIER